MIRFKNLTISRGGINLLENIEVAIVPGEKLAIIGPNGSGKTTMMRALMGEVLPDGGDIEMAKMSTTVLKQQPPSSQLPAWEHVVATDPALTGAQEALAKAHEDDDGLAIAEAMDAWQQAGGSDAQARCRELLHGLGFGHDMANQSVDQLSGGWRMRLNLAACLFRPSELMLLDEPTNHLDLDAILWLERRLRRYTGTLLVISHDRDFLDGVVDGTLSIENLGVRRYRGGYSACEKQRAERAQHEQRSADQTRRQADHLQQFIDRFRAQATKARQVQSRIKAMEKLQIAAPLQAGRKLRLALPDVGNMPNPVMHTENLSAGYDGQALLDKITVKVERGDRIGILGRNGQGKTTLIKTLIGNLPPISGLIQASPQVRVSYFEQDAVDHLPATDSPLDFIRRETLRHRSVAPPDSELRGWLGRFGFAQEDAMRHIGPMSGGERARLVLSAILWSRPQWLVLDEPTNHLDGDTRDALTEALLDFSGVLMVVSHDRYLLRACVDRFLLVDEGQVSDFDGSLDDYAKLLTDGAPTAHGNNTSQDQSGVVDNRSKKEQRRDAANKRAEHAARLKPLRRKINTLDTQMDRLGRRIEQLDQLLGEAETYDNPDKLATLTRERGEKAGARDALEVQWLELAEQLESESPTTT